jgi:hypothetical protein
MRHPVFSLGHFLACLQAGVVHVQTKPAFPETLMAPAHLIESIRQAREGFDAL